MLKKDSFINPVSVLPIPKGAVTWLAISIVVTIGWHISHTPVWAWSTALVLGALVYPLIIKDKPLPTPIVRITLALCTVGGIFITYNGFLGRDPGITALVMMSTLKLMELKTRRDFMILVFLCYFLVFGNFLFDQTIQDLAFTLAATLLITSALIRLNLPDSEIRKRRVSYVLKFTLRLFIYALPFTILLFFLFPRSRGPLWNFSQSGANRGESGFSDSMKPGQIAELAMSKQPAFQVEFLDGNIPLQKDLYFRGLILWFTDGKEWSQGVLVNRGFRSPANVGANAIRQLITLYPHQQRWLFGLDYPVELPERTRIFPGNIFQAPYSIREITRYTVFSQRDEMPEDQWDKEARYWSLRLPRFGSKRIIELGDEWRNSVYSDREVVRLAERYFKENNFVYSLRPGEMDQEEPMEDFLFNKRKGFCEHYASAFALLMRAARVPARVVVGYQGGQYNAIGKYLMVKQSDAHAWTEVYLQGEGWKRVDPTSWVSPERIEYGAEVSETLSELGNLTGKSREDAIRNALNENFVKKIWKFLKLNWDNVNYKWDVWIMSYDRYRQRDFFRGLGFDNVNRGVLFLVVITLIPFLFFILSYLLKRRALSPDPLLNLYSIFCVKMEKIGIRRMRWEGPLHFKERASLRFPEKRHIIDEISDTFIQLRYGRGQVTKNHLKHLKQLIKKI